MRVGIYAGARAAPAAMEVEVRRFVRDLVGLGAGIVYGGGATGMMGAIAEEALAAGADVIGVIPATAEGGERAHPGLTRLEVTADRERRNARIRDLSDVVVAVPGASGTLEEIVESWSLFRLGVHSTPCAVLDVAGFFDPLFELVDRMRRAGFIGVEPPSLTRVHSADDVGKLISNGS